MNLNCCQAFAILSLPESTQRSKDRPQAWFSKVIMINDGNCALVSELSFELNFKLRSKSNIRLISDH